MRRFLVFACLAVPLVSQALIIDDFTVPYTRTISTGTWVDFQTDPTLFTGERDVQVGIQEGFTGDTTLTIGNGLLTIVNGPATRYSARLQYDGIGDEVGNIGPNKTLINSTGPENPFPEGARTIRFHVASCEVGATVGVEILQQGVVQFNTSRTVLAGGPRIIDIPVHPAIMPRSDSVILRAVTSSQSASLSLSKVEVVPELGSGLMMAAGTLGLLAAAKKGGGQK